MGKIVKRLFDLRLPQGQSGFLWGPRRVGKSLRDRGPGTDPEHQNIPAFAEFLRIVAITSSELLNYANVARETGVSPKVVRT